MRARHLSYQLSYLLSIFQQHMYLMEILYLTYVAFTFLTLIPYTSELTKLQWDTGRILKTATTIERTTIQVVQLGYSRILKKYF